MSADPSSSPALRASAAQRDRVIGPLHAGVADGRFDPAEPDERPGGLGGQFAGVAGDQDGGYHGGGQRFAPPRTYAPPGFVKDETGRDLIPLTAAEARRLFNLHTRVIRPRAFHERWSGWRRRRRASARGSHCGRRP